MTLLNSIRSFHLCSQRLYIYNIYYIAFRYIIVQSCSLSPSFFTYCSLLSVSVSQFIWIPFSHVSPTPFHLAYPSISSPPLLHSSFPLSLLLSEFECLSSYFMSQDLKKFILTSYITLVFPLDILFGKWRGGNHRTYLSLLEKMWKHRENTKTNKNQRVPDLV